MKTASKPLQIHQNDRIRQCVMDHLARKKREIFSGSKDQPGKAASSHRILRAEIAVAGLDTLSWLCAQQPTSRGYWSDRENRFELAGCGGADIITGDSDIDYPALMATLHRRLDTAQGNPRYFGGLRFAINGSPKTPWQHFKAYRFILPRFEVVTRDDETIFACNMLSHEDLGVVENAFDKLVFPDTTALPKRLHAESRLNLPDKPQWCQSVADVLAAFEPGFYEKVVLARQATFTFPAALDAAALLRALKEKTSHCFHFLFQPHAQSGFLGASPERLYRRDHKVIQTEAIAGSRPRGHSREEDLALSTSLINSEKDLREHGYVVREIHRILSRFCNLLDVEKTPRVLALDRCQHLITAFKGKLKDGVKDPDLLESLHPTPAVGGFPRKRALEDIARIEPFDRGWYAGPVGWIEKDASQFVVGIRSGLTEGNRLHLYSGAGIVTGSHPEDEWEEIETKIGDFLSLFTPERA
jgi:menaquinone-specific isochorismate synthase